MNKCYFSQWGMLLPIVVAFLFSACTKDLVKDKNESEQAMRALGRQHNVTVPFKMHSDTWYRFSPTAPVAVSIPGQIGFAYVPGYGTGNATHMGRIATWFNQLAYSPTGENPPAGTVNAPVAAIAGYAPPFPGAPLPLVQPGDFATFAADNAWLQIPTSIDGHIVNSVIFNNKGDALFLTQTTSSQTVFVSPTRINFGGQGIFLGGRGQFAGATGVYDFTGFFNPQDANDAGFAVDGQITY